MGPIGGVGGLYGVYMGLWGFFGGSYGALKVFYGAELWASFRGRRLGGRERLLPHGYRGGVLQRSPTHGSDGDTQEVTLTATFDAITEWGADNVPPPLGGLANALQWGPLAQAIHSSIPVNDSEEAEP